MKDDQDQQLPIWPPAIVSNPTELLPEKTNHDLRKTLGKLLFGLFCGCVLSLIIGVGIIIVCMKVGGTMNMNGTQSAERATTQRVAKIVEFLLLSSPLLVCVVLRTRFPSFALGFLIGGALLNLGFFKLFFF